jgi:hypothetical protein
MMLSEGWPGTSCRRQPDRHQQGALAAHFEPELRAAHARGLALARIKSDADPPPELIMRLFKQAQGRRGPRAPGGDDLLAEVQVRLVGGR